MAELVLAIDARKAQEGAAQFAAATKTVQTAAGSAVSSVERMGDAATSAEPAMDGAGDSAAELSSKLSDLSGRGDRVGEVMQAIIRRSPYLLGADLIARVVGFNNVMDVLNTTLDNAAEGIRRITTALTGFEFKAKESAEALDPLVEKLKALHEQNEETFVRVGQFARVDTSGLEDSAEALGAIADAQAKIRAQDDGSVAGQRTEAQARREEMEVVTALRARLTELRIEKRKMEEEDRKADDAPRKREREADAVQAARTQVTEMIRALEEEGSVIDKTSTQRAGMLAVYQAEAVARRANIVLGGDELDTIQKLAEENERRQSRREAMFADAEATERAREELSDYIAELDDEIDMLGMNDRQRFIHIETRKLLNKTIAAGITLPEDELKKQHDKILALAPEVEDASTKAAKNMADAFEQATLSIVQDIDSAADAGKALWNAMIMEMFQGLVFAPWKGSIQGFFGSLFGALGMGAAGGGSPPAPGGLDLPEKSAATFDPGIGGSAFGVAGGVAMAKAGSITIVQHIHTPDAGSFMRSQRQVAQSARRAMQEVR